MPSKDINWYANKELLEWKEVASEKQRFYFEFLKSRRWELYEPTEHELLKTKILFALYGPPVNVQETTHDKFYSPVQRKSMEEIFYSIKKVNKNSNNLIVGFLFFIASIDNKYTEFPVIRVLKNKEEDGTERFCIVDSFGYLYKNWQKFLATNIIPYCIYCFPKDGFYYCNFSGELELEYSYSPQSYSIYSGVVSAVGTVGSAVTTVLPSRSSTADHLPIPLISIIKGVAPKKRNYWIPVSLASGSSDLYFIHSTHSFAKSSQSLEGIPHVLYDALENGYLKINWYAILNDIKNIIQHSSKTTYTHVAHVIVSALFFCHAVLTPLVTKQIIREIRNDISNGRKFKLDHIGQIALENSISIDKKSVNHPLIIILKFIDDRVGLVNEIIETKFKANFMIPDHFGNYHTIKSLTEKFGNSNETKKYADIIINYCLVLEEIIRNCNNCNKIIDDHSKFMETLNSKMECSLSEEKKLQGKVDSSYKKNDVYSKSILKPVVNENRSKLSPHLIDYDDNETSCGKSPCFPFKFSLGNEDSDEIENKKECLINEWLRTNFFSKFSSPLPPSAKNVYVNSKSSLEEKEFELVDKNDVFEIIKGSAKERLIESPLHNNLYSEVENNTSELSGVASNDLNMEETPIKFERIYSKSTKKTRNTKKSIDYLELMMNESKNLPEVKTPSNMAFCDSPVRVHGVIPNRDENDSSLMMIRNSTTPTNSTPKNGKYDYSNNINTPDSKTCDKQMPMDNNEELPSSSRQNIEVKEHSFDEMSIALYHRNKIEEESEDDEINPNMSKGSESVLSSLSARTSLSGKVCVFTRENIAEELSPMDYYKNFVEEELKEIESVYVVLSQTQEKFWQFILNEEILGVKIIKIHVLEETSHETIRVKYY